MEQFYLFDMDEYNIHKRDRKLVNLRNSIRTGWYPFSIDKLQKASTMYGVLCEVVWKTYERVTDEQKLSDNSESD